MEKDKVYEKVIIVGIEKQHEEEAFNYSFDELEQLVENAGGKVVARLSQKESVPIIKRSLVRGKSMNSRPWSKNWMHRLSYSTWNCRQAM